MHNKNRRADVCDNPQRMINQKSSCLSSLKDINFSYNCSGNTPANQTLEQEFLSYLWMNFESLQDEIPGQDTKKFQLLEILNSIRFEACIKAGRR